jgi:hypothetical protein
MTITNVSTDDLFDGAFQQKILVVDKMINDLMATIAQLYTDRKHKNYVQIKITHNNIMSK